MIEQLHKLLSNYTRQSHKIQSYLNSNLSLIYIYIVYEIEIENNYFNYITIAHTSNPNVVRSNLE